MSWPAIPPWCEVIPIANERLILNRSTRDAAVIDGMSAALIDMRTAFEGREDAADDLVGLYGTGREEVIRALAAVDTQLQPLLRRGVDTDEVLVDNSLPQVPGHLDTISIVDVLGIGVAIDSDRSRDAVIDECIRHLPISLQTPTDRLAVWSERDRWVIARNSTTLEMGLDTGLLVSTLVAELTCHVTRSPAADRALIHAAAVNVDGRGVMFVGGTNQGKSSTTLELTRDGRVAYLTDELVELDPYEGAVRGLTRPLFIDGEMCDMNADLAPSWQNERPGRKRWPIWPPRISTEPAPLTGTYFLRFDGTQPVVETPLSPAQAMAHLVGGLHNIGTISSTTLESLAQLLVRTRRTGLHHSGGQACARFLEEQWSR